MEEGKPISSGLWGAFFASLFFVLVLVGVDYVHKNPTIAVKNIFVKHPAPWDPASVSWQKVTDHAPWEERDSHAVFIFNDKLWIAGGLNGNSVTGTDDNPEYWKAPYFNDIWNTADGVNWERVVEHAEWPPRRSMTITPFNGTLYMFGGWMPNHAYKPDVWNSVDGIVWTKQENPAPWPAREGFTTEVYDGKLWFFGGVNYTDHVVYNDVWYTADGVTWTQATEHAPWSPRWDYATTQFQGEIWLAAGMDLSMQSFNDVWHTKDGVNWIQAPEVPWVTRQGEALVTYHDHMYLYSRLNDKESGVGPNDTWYTADGVTWNKLTDNPWIGREDLGYTVWHDAMWAIGGMDSNWKWENDVWKLAPVIPEDKK